MNSWYHSTRTGRAEARHDLSNYDNFLSFIYALMPSSLYFSSFFKVPATGHLVAHSVGCGAEQPG